MQMGLEVIPQIKWLHTGSRRGPMTHWCNCSVKRTACHAWLGCNMLQTTSHQCNHCARALLILLITKQQLNNARVVAVNTGRFDLAAAGHCMFGLAARCLLAQNLNHTAEKTMCIM